MDIESARRYLRQCERILVITGAGMSAASGVPTFRGAGSRWKEREVSELATLKAFEADPKFIWDWYLYRRSLVAACQPNVGHRILAAWSKDRPQVTLVTQNVDGLHDEASQERLVNMHGSLWRNRCTACGREREDRALCYHQLPRSPCCHALERPAIVWMGERVAESDIKLAVAAAFDAEAVVTIGTSAKISTVTNLVSIARARHAEIFDINLERSNVNAHCRLFGPAGELLPRLLAA
jgi:NAD-dependent deacetylase